MKSILFLIGSLDSGGVAKSLVNTLNAIDCVSYDVDLMIMNGRDGVFSEYIPKEVNIIRHWQASAAVCGIKGLKQLCLHGKFLPVFISVIRIVTSLFNKAYAGWLLSRIFPKINKQYDLIVDYNGQQQLYYMVDKLNGKKKVTFFHSDYDKWHYYKSMDKKYYPKVDAIFTISPQCVQSMKRNFPEVAEKILLFENISSPSVIYKLAEEPIKTDGLHGSVFVTIGHVWAPKGIDLAIDAAKILQQRKIDFTWLFIGKIAEPEWQKVVSDKGLQENIIFLGIKSNPYPYMRLADIIVHPSRFEGKSIALDEAKILCKPIIVTNFSTVNDQFIDGVNASICEMYGESIANRIEQMIDDKTISLKYIDYLKSHIIDNSSEINKLLNIID